MLCPCPRPATTASPSKRFDSRSASATSSHSTTCRLPCELSGGQRQRVALARALAAKPTIVLLDEPFGALDAITRAELQESFAALRAQLAMTCVIVTHDLHEALLLATHVAVLRRGR